MTYTNTLVLLRLLTADDDNFTLQNTLLSISAVKENRVFTHMFCQWKSTVRK